MSSNPDQFDDFDDVSSSLHDVDTTGDHSLPEKRDDVSNSTSSSNSMNIKREEFKSDIHNNNNTGSATSHFTRSSDKEEDEVVMEYEVYLSHSLEKSLYLIQYPLKPKERPFDFKALKDISLKPEHGILSMDFALNPHAPDFDSDSEFKKKNKLTWKSKPVPLKSNYCVAVMRGTSLFFTPLKNVVKMLPDNQYLNEHFENEVRVIDDDESDSEDPEKKERKAKKVAAETQIVQQFQSKRELRELEKSYHYIQSLEEQEKPVPLKFFDKDSFSVPIFEKLLTAPFGEIVFDMDRKQYIDTLVPYKEDPLEKFNKKVISLDTIMKEKSLKNQIYLIMQAAKILSFQRIKELATLATDDHQILNILSSVAFFIQGRWIASGDTANEPGMIERWNLMVIRFWRDGYIDRASFAKEVCLPAEKCKEMLQLVAELDHSERLWRLKGEEDLEFASKHPELLETQEKHLQSLESETLHHIETGFTKLSAQSKDKASMVLTEDDIIKVTNRFLIQLASQYGVVSAKLLKLKFAEVQSKNEQFKKVTVDYIRRQLSVCYRRFNGSFILRKCLLGDEAAPFRDALILVLEEKKQLSKEEILESVEKTVGKQMSSNMFFKFTQELCRKPSTGSKIYVAKDGLEHVS